MPSDRRWWYKCFFELINCQQIKFPAANLYIIINRSFSHHAVPSHRNTTVWLVSCQTESCTVCTSFPVDLPHVHVPRLPVTSPTDYSAMEVIITKRFYWSAAFTKNSDYYDFPETVCYPSPLSIRHLCRHTRFCSIEISDFLLLCQSVLFPYASARSMQCFHLSWWIGSQEKDSLKNTH